jgi:hypothetical protein
MIGSRLVFWSVEFPKVRELSLLLPAYSLGLQYCPKIVSLLTKITPFRRVLIAF